MSGQQYFSLRWASVLISLCALFLMSSCAGTPPSSATSLSSITVAPTNVTISVGATQPFTATGNYSNGSTKNLTSSVIWQSQNATAATISAGGMVTAKAQGSSTIMATMGSVSGSTLLTVSSGALVSIAVTPANPSIAKGSKVQFTATGTFSDNSTQNLTSSVTWTSQTNGVATIAAGGSATAVGTGTSQIQATSGAVSGSTILTVTSATLVSVAVTPANPSIVKGQTEQFTATGTFSDNSTQNLTSSVVWTSQTPGVVTITAGGLATGVASGTSKIEAASGAIDGTTNLTVTAPTLVSIAVTPADPSIVKGQTEQFTATGTLSDHSTQNLTSTATWTSQTTAVATIAAGGLATGVKAGTSKIQAASGGVSGSTTLTVTSPTLVSIAVTPANPSIAKGTKQQFTATGTFSDNSTQNLASSVTWTSATTSVATIGASGLAAGVGTGTSTIRAASGAVNGSTTLTVTSATLVSIVVTPAGPSAAKGAKEQFTATGTFSDNSTQNLTNTATWTSQTTSVATIAAGGLATAVAAGKSTIKAASGAVSGSTTLTVTAATLVSIAVTPANPSVKVGAKQQFTATGTFSDNSTQNLTSSVTWSSATTGVATITTGGLATGVAAGTSTIKAASGAVSGSTTLTVTAATLVSIAVTPANPSIKAGAKQQFTATGTFSDNSTQNLTSSVTWSSATTGVATITTGGLATGVAVGTSTIKAVSGTVSGSTTLTVTAATLTSIAVTPANPSIKAGAKQQFTATGTFSDNSTQNLTGSVTWSSATTGVATITTGGLATGVAAGTSTIKAVSGTVSGSTTLTVTAVTLVSIAVTPVNPSIAKGATQQFTATGTFSDNSTQNLTGSVTWSSATTGVATITTSGLATAVAAGTSTIKAASGAISGSTTLTVTSTSTTLQVLVVSPQNPVIADNSATQAFTATGHFSDGSTQNLTSSATWTSSSSGVASVSIAGVATSKALASGVNASFASIQAVVGTVKGASILSVTNHTSNSSGFAGVLTQHNDIGRTGQNLSETVLTPANVNTATFGKKFSQTVDGFIYAQPLYVPNVTIGGSVHNVIYVATEGDSVYAFDADSNTGANAAPLWKASMILPTHGAAAGATTMNSSTPLGCTDLVPQVGITSTPAIDPTTGTIYVEAKSVENGNFVHRLHALDMTTGAEKSPGPVVITGTVTGTGDGTSGGTVTFDGLHQMNRPGLLWLNGILYLSYASHCDDTPYHGWLFAYDAGTFAKKSQLVTSPNGNDGGFWMSGAGVAADSNANIFIASGNGDFDTTNIPARELGDTNMKLFYSGSSTMSLLDYFTPQDQSNLDGEDNDLGSGGNLLLPDQPGAVKHELVQVGKEGNIYLINRDQMTANNLHYCQTSCNGTDAQITQEVQGEISGLFSLPAYLNGTLYFCGVGDTLKSFPLTNGLLATSPSQTASHNFGFPGATPSASADGSTNGIIWVIDTTAHGNPSNVLGPAVLYAYEAGNLTPLWNSSQTGNDDAGNAVKFAVPTIANGKVYIGTQTELDVYGTLP